MLFFLNICYTGFMLIVLGIFSMGLLGLIIYFAFSSKSSRFLKLAAKIALGLIGIAIAVCSVFIVLGPSEDVMDIPLPVFSDAPPEQPRRGNVFEIVIFLAILAMIISLLVYLSIKDQKKKAEALKKKAEKPPVYEDKEDVMDTLDDLKTGSSDEEKFDDDDFNIGLS